MTENSRIGREPIEVLQIDQDFCQNTYGEAPCTASLAVGGRKCFNTRATCQDPANYNRGTLTLNFCSNQARLPQDGNYYLPYLSNVKITPGRINPGGGSISSSALGMRSVITATLTDHPHNDRIVDPYEGERDYDPFERGTFWTKWRARNPFYVNRPIRHISGYLDSDGQIVDSITRTYFIDKMSGPDASGTVQFTGKDVLSLAQNLKAKAPAASKGKLNGAMGIGSSFANLTPTGIGDEEYPASGYVRIGGEVMAFTRTGDTLAVTRAQYNTEEATHDAGDTVQLCLVYTSESPPDILYDLLTEYAGIDPVYLDKAAWDTEATDYLPRLYSAIITEPTGVSKLIQEMTDQMYFYIWWDERDDLVKLRAVRPAEDETIYQLNRSRHLIADSVKVADQPDQRLTQVWVYHALRDPTQKLDEAQNYGALEIIANAKGGENQYQTEQVKVVYSRWITSANGAAAVDLGNKLLARYGTTPRSISFSLDAKDRDVWVGSFAQVSTRLAVDDVGQSIPMNIQVFSANEQSLGTTYSYTGQEFVFEEEPDSGELLVIISADTNNVNMRTLFDSTLGVTPSGTVRFIVRSNVLIGSTSTGSPALNVGSWDSGVNLLLDIEPGAFIAGAGGDGGNGGNAFVDGQNGGRGGDAINAAFPITINNLGTIGGGGGGGGGGGASGLIENGAGGGGGAGRVAGAGGDGRTIAPVSSDGTPGSLEDGGFGGTIGLDGGDGGDLGQDGERGISGTSTSSGNGGKAGNAVDGVAFITWENKGDVRGPEI